LQTEELRIIICAEFYNGGNWAWNMIWACFLLYIDETRSITLRLGWMMPVNIPAQTWSSCSLATKGFILYE